MAKIKNIVGEKFGRLTVKVQTNERAWGSVIWECICDCGELCKVSSCHLKSGSTKSCGCMQLENRFKNGSQVPYDTKSDIYHIWANMKYRCLNDNAPHYEDYGGRGIKVAEEWIDSFEAFLEDVGERPSKLHSLERLNVNGDYCKENITWALPAAQTRNRRKMRNNKTGKTGVRVREIDGNLYYFANWYELDGKLKEKCFSVIKYGNDLALKMASEYRDKMIEELNAQGAGYSELHGL